MTSHSAPPARRIAYLLTQDRGGPVDVTIALAAELDARPGYQVRLYGPPPARGLDRVAHLLSESRVEGKGAASQIAAARRRLLDWSPDIVHAQDRRAGLVCVRLGGLHRPRPAVVHTYHGVPDDVTQDWLEDPGAPAPSVYTRAVLTADRAVARSVDRTVVVADLLRGFLVNRLRVPAQRVTHIDNGLALPAPAPRGVGPVRRLVFVGLLVQRKGVDVLLRALTRAVQLGAPDDLTLAVVGDGPERAALQELAGALGLSDRVDFLGFRTDVPDLLAASDAFVLPARMEQQPLVIIEAMAAGLDVLATDVGGVREMLHGHGRVVAPDDVDALADELIGLTRIEPTERARLRRSQIAYAQARFGIATCLDHHLALYAELRKWPPPGQAG